MNISADDSDCYSSASETFPPIESTHRTDEGRHDTKRQVGLDGQRFYVRKSLRRTASKRKAPQPPTARRPYRSSRFLQGTREAEAKVIPFINEVPLAKHYPVGVRKNSHISSSGPVSAFQPDGDSECGHVNQIFSSNPRYDISECVPTIVGPSLTAIPSSTVSTMLSQPHPITYSMTDTVPVKSYPHKIARHKEKTLDDGYRAAKKPLHWLHHSVSDPEVPKRRQYLASVSHHSQLADVEEENRDRSTWIVEKWQNQSDDRSEPPPMRPRTDSVITVAHICEDLIVSSRFKLKVTLTNLSLVVMIAAFIMPNFAAILFSVFRLVFGVLFPAYYSYKAVRTKDLKEYVTWMMYWIVFALFTCVETFTDIFLSFWFPFYYEIKILVVLWLLSPATRGSSFLYRQFVHPWLITREGDIDECIEKAKQQGYSTVVEFGTKSVQYATNVIMQTALKGGGGLMTTLKRSYSTNDVGEEWGNKDVNRNIRVLTGPENDEDVVDYEPRLRSDSDGSRLRSNRTPRSRRALKSKSMDVSDLLDDIPDSVLQRRSPRIQEAAKDPVIPAYLEPLLEEPRPRKGKFRKAVRAHSFTMPKTLRETLLEAQNREVFFPSDVSLMRSSTLPRRLTRSFRIRPTYVH